MSQNIDLFSQLSRIPERVESLSIEELQELRTTVVRIIQILNDFASGVVTVLPTLPVATAQTDGLLSSGLFLKLVSLDPEAEKNTVTSVNNMIGAVTITKESIGLGNVDNTSDLQKPVSLAVYEILEQFADISTLEDSLTSLENSIQQKLDLKADRLNVNKVAGLLNTPTITYDGTMLYVGACEAFLSTDLEYVADTEEVRVTVPAATFDVTIEGLTHHVAVVYEEAVGAYYTFAQVEDILEHPNKVEVAVVIRTGTVFHIFQAEALSTHLANNLHKLLLLRDGYRKVSGLMMTVGSARNLTISEGLASFGASIKELSDIDSSINPLSLYVQVSGTWTRTAISALNNMQYNEPTSGLVTMNPNRFNINWIWRGVETQKHAYVVISASQYHTLAEAEIAPFPVIPSIIKDHTVFVGGIIYERGAEFPAGFINPSRNGSAGIGSTIHNNLSGLQGGNSVLSEFFHLSAEEYQKVQEVSQIRTFIDGQSAAGLMNPAYAPIDGGNANG